MGKSAPRGPQPGDVSGGSASSVPAAKGPSAMAAEKHALDLLASSSLTSWRRGVSAQGAKGRGRTDGGWAGRQRGDGDGDGDGDRPWGGKTAGRQGLGGGGAGRGGLVRQGGGLGAITGQREGPRGKGKMLEEQK